MAYKQCSLNAELSTAREESVIDRCEIDVVRSTASRCGLTQD
jgi:hypothetical protein